MPGGMRKGRADCSARRASIGRSVAIVVSIASCALASSIQPANADVDAAKPRRGGTITVGEFIPPTSLDPISVPGTALAGEDEGIALYDILMRFELTTHKYV